jgi:hypothetical protein
VVIEYSEYSGVFTGGGVQGIPNICFFLFFIIIYVKMAKCMVIYGKINFFRLLFGQKLKT